jgi:hypothetical protein
VGDRVGDRVAIPLVASIVILITDRLQPIHGGWRVICFPLALIGVIEIRRHHKLMGIRRNGFGHDGAANMLKQFVEIFKRDEIVWLDHPEVNSVWCHF